VAVDPKKRCVAGCLGERAEGYEGDALVPLLDRVRCRGTPAFHVQLLLGCAAINLKRLAKHAPTAQQGIAATTQTVAAALGSDNDRRQHLSQRPSIRLGRQQLVWTASLCLN